MHGLVLIVLASILASTVYAEPEPGAYHLTDTPGSDGVTGCTGKLILEPPLKKGDIE